MTCDQQIGFLTVVFVWVALMAFACGIVLGSVLSRGRGQR